MMASLKYLGDEILVNYNKGILIVMDNLVYRSQFCRVQLVKIFLKLRFAFRFSYRALDFFFVFELKNESWSIWKIPRLSIVMSNVNFYPDAIIEKMFSSVKISLRF